MYSYRIEKDSVKIIEDSEENLRENDLEIFETRARAQARGNNELFRRLRKEWNRLDDYTDERAVELERLMYKDLVDHTNDYTENMYVIQMLQDELAITADDKRKEVIIQRLKELQGQ
mgnify:CR=1 FL=1